MLLAGPEVGHKTFSMVHQNNFLLDGNLLLIPWWRRLNKVSVGGQEGSSTPLYQQFFHLKFP